MYLPPEAVRDLFCQCAAISGPGSRMAFSYIPAGADGRLDAGPWTGFMLWLQKVSGEPWLWSIRPDQLPNFLIETGWTYARELAGESDKQGVEFFSVAAQSSKSL